MPTTVTAFHDAEGIIERSAAENNLDFTYVLEQASFIESSLTIVPISARVSLIRPTRWPSGSRLPSSKTLAAVIA